MEAASVCVVGAGITGISVANNLARAGVQVSLVDQRPYPGGLAVYYGCKADGSCVRCGVCSVRDAMRSLRQSPLISCYFSSSPSVALRSDGGYLVDLETRPNRIDWQSCTECGACREACPRGAVEQVPGWKYYVSEECTACGDCVNACPVGAIRMHPQAQEKRISAQGIVVAAGFHPFDPSANRKWGYGNSPRVKTLSEVERLFFRETYRPQDAQSIAFVQCVGSRDVREGEPHCSRVCCSTALRMANRIVSEFPDTRIDVYYMDVQHFGRDFDGFLERLSGKVRLIRSNPLCVGLQEGKALVRCELLPDLRCEERAYDLVVLSNGMCPPQSGEALAEIFGLDLDAQGYLRSTEPGNGIFVAGSCRGPMAIAESIEDASAVAHRMQRHLATMPPVWDGVTERRRDGPKVRAR